MKSLVYLLIPLLRISPLVLATPQSSSSNRNVQVADGPLPPIEAENGENSQQSPPGFRLPYSSYQSELYAKGFSGQLPLITTDPNKLEEQARTKMNPKAFGFIAGGSGERATMDANRAAFRQWKIVPRMWPRAAQKDLSITLFGKRHPTPILISPIGFQHTFHPDAEPGTASVAKDLGIPFVMSMNSGASIEEIAKGNGDGERWYQLYWQYNDDRIKQTLNRAKAAGYSVLVVTLDNPTLGWRPMDLDQGYLAVNPPKQQANSSGSGFSSFGWDSLKPSAPPGWERIPWLREQWNGTVLLKGIQHPDDAKAAVTAGVDGIIVSNHGGRQLDGAIASLDALPDIVDAVGGRITVLFDSGIRTGADVIKALSLGANGVLVGRPWAYGLGIAGKEGARSVLRGILAQLEINMEIAGLKTIADCKRDILRKVTYGTHPASSN